MSQSFGDTAFSPKGVIWVLSIFERIRLSRYCAAIRERNSFLYRICKKNIFCSKYMIKWFIFGYRVVIFYLTKHCKHFCIYSFKNDGDPHLEFLVYEPSCGNVTVVLQPISFWC